MTEETSPQGDEDGPAAELFRQAMEAVAGANHESADELYSQVAMDCAKQTIASHHPDRQDEEVDVVVLEPEGMSVRVIIAPVPSIAVVAMFEPDEETIPTTFMAAPALLTRDNAAWLRDAIDKAIHILDEHMESCGGDPGLADEDGDD